MSFKFHGWQVYKDARTFRKEVKQTTKTWPSDEKYILISQTDRAALSVVLAIAEGSNRRTENNKIVFINRALTSLDEVMACFDCALDDVYIDEDKYKYFYNQIENLAKQLRGLENHLKNAIEHPES
ncbi:MAG: four helix bundle protein [Candidatus Doudnabacteria bacterium]|nr:four helix bundle protein [Candidatus Doudnabacteria bacterium]